MSMPPSTWNLSPSELQVKYYVLDTDSTKGTLQQPTLTDSASNQSIKLHTKRPRTLSCAWSKKLIIPSPASISESDDKFRCDTRQVCVISTSHGAPRPTSVCKIIESNQDHLDSLPLMNPDKHHCISQEEMAQHPSTTFAQSHLQVCTRSNMKMRIAVTAKHCAVTMHDSIKSCCWSGQWMPKQARLPCRVAGHALQ